MALLCLGKGKFYKECHHSKGMGYGYFFAGEICEIDPFILTFCTPLQKFDIDDFTEK